MHWNLIVSSCIKSFKKWPQQNTPQENACLTISSQDKLIELFNGKCWTILLTCRVTSYMSRNYSGGVCPVVSQKGKYISLFKTKLTASSSYLSPLSSTLQSLPSCLRVVDPTVPAPSTDTYARTYEKMSSTWLQSHCQLSSTD